LSDSAVLWGCGYGFNAVARGFRQPTIPMGILFKSKDNGQKRFEVLNTAS
jgi:hypothetical protein